LVARATTDDGFEKQSAYSGISFMIWNHGSSVKEFKLHNLAIFHTNYASSRFDPISRLTCCSLFDQANLTVLATEIAASSRFFS